MANVEAVTNYAGMKALLADTVEKQREITSLRNQITGRAPRINLTTQTDHQLNEMQQRAIMLVEFKNRRERAVDSLRRNVQLMKSALEQSKRKPVGANPNTILDSINESLNGIQQIANQIIEVIGIERGRRQRERQIAMREAARQQELARQEQERQHRLQLIEQRRQQAERARLQHAAEDELFGVMNLEQEAIPWKSVLRALTDEELDARINSLIRLPIVKFNFLYNYRLNDEQKERFLEARRAMMPQGPQDELPTDVWNGYTRSDINNLNSVFDPDKVPIGYRSYRETYAACPVCLEYVDRGAGCLYIKDHNCKERALARGDGLYHRKLYDKYKNKNGSISFCAICARICSNAPEHHYGLKKHDGTPVIAPPIRGQGNISLLPGEQPCIQVGGGGFKEKIMRYNALRNKAHELNRLRGKITRYEALKQMIEAAWDAPLNPPEALNTTKFTLANTAFPTKFRRTMGKIEKPKNTRILIPSDGYQEPLLVEEGTNVISYENDPPLVQFRHIDKDGNPFDHSESLLSKLSILGHIKDGQKGEFIFKCPIDTCMGYLYPEEIESAFSKTLTKANGGEVGFELDENEKKLVAYYRKLFYNAFKTTSENNAVANNNNANVNVPSIAGLFGNSDSDSLIHEMQDGTCSIGGGGAGGGGGGGGTEGGGANGTLEGGRRRRKSRKYRKRNRKTRKN